MYRVLLYLERGDGPWWWRLLSWLGVDLTLRTDRHISLVVYQAGAETPLRVDGYVGADLISTKVSFAGSARLVRETRRP